MPDFYNTEYQKYYDSTFNVDSSSFLSPLAKMLRPGASVLDVGCGSGRDLLWLKERGYHPTGFERSQKLAALARQYSGCPVIEDDFLTYDFSALKFEAILMIGALVHLSVSQLEPAFLSITAALEENGLVLLSLKEGHGQTHAEDGRVFVLWQPEKLEHLFLKNGFRILDFSRQISKICESDVWLGYLLQKTRIKTNDGN
ncbi:MAG: class I SAM-dependent methyltransferase [Desulfobacteraceae bacterium]|nr:MAG: class I SAM-dependent methyltransferase [Desulfobacteraceae bacterium]